MWKKIGAVLLAVALAALFAACAEDSALHVKPAETDAGEQLPNPIKECESSADFAPLDLYIDAPEGASDVTYTTISDEIAQIHFTLGDCIYVYRAAHTQDDISGLYVTFDEIEHGIEADGADWYASVRVRTIDEGKLGALAQWTYGTAQFTLYTGDPVDVQTISDLAVDLAETAFAYHME